MEKKKKWPEGVLTDRQRKKRKELQREANKGALVGMSSFWGGGVVFYLSVQSFGMRFLETINPLPSEQLILFQVVVGLLWFILSVMAVDTIVDFVLRKYFGKELRFQMTDYNIGHILVDIDKSNYEMPNQE